MRVRRLVITCAAALLLIASPLATPSFADDLIADDASANVTGAWQPATTTPGFYGDGYRYHVAGDGSNRVRWAFSGAAGSYEVFARWTSGPNRASNATYVVTHA